MKSIELNADKVKVRGPRVDGSWVISFETGEYEQEKIAQLLTIPQQTPLKLTVSLYDEG